MFDSKTLDVFVASTNDLAKAREAVEEVLRDWNFRIGTRRQIVLRPIRWEEDAAPELGPGSFQDVINKQLLDAADILIGIVGKRLGSPTKTSISGTVEEITRFRDAKKPVLLYFSDEQLRPSEINTQELERVREFRKSMQDVGLYLTFKDIGEFKTRLRSDIDSLLQDFIAMLIPGASALAYGYFKNFVELVHDMLRGREVDLPDHKTQKSLSYSSFRIRIAKPDSLDDATDQAAFDLKDKFLGEVSVKTKQMRRAFRIYVPKDLHKRLVSKIDVLDVIDFPTPMIALRDFVSYRKGLILKGKSDNAVRYWQRQEDIQYNEFFDSLDDYIEKAGKKGPSIQYFDYNTGPRFTLPV